jgi:Trypsin
VNVPNTGEMVCTKGFVKTIKFGLMSDKLLKEDVSIIDRQTCATLYPDYTVPLLVADVIICAGVLETGGKDSCAGDSWGSLLRQSITLNATISQVETSNLLVGLISWGEGCACTEYANIIVYDKWIRESACLFSAFPCSYSSQVPTYRPTSSLPDIPLSRQHPVLAVASFRRWDLGY